MKKVVLKLKAPTILAKVAFGRLVAKSIDGNDDFPNPSPTVAEIDTASDEFETANDEAKLARQLAK